MTKEEAYKVVNVKDALKMQKRQLSLIIIRAIQALQDEGDSVEEIKNRLEISDYYWFELIELDQLNNQLL